ncbi:class III lanthionine synthetase LanKC [Actinacidiphila sp. DG2A-62]|uniref:class III lanthionine synthetase LanKC n=1 Tax=Actinacidiphila sp. DG2A-62 TaxID=3108821 RepID=UPI002DBD23BB|nr:class III lanthionine synthetase LanKC [Actinacidiphila sp. DG2A-62]MEC3992497.1 class III lanthionine synthetase LanKC [Actinacidiphila sp. DG2A-62]
MMRDPQTTQFYCVADDLWFDTPARMADEDSRFGPAAGPVAEGWRRSGQGLWSVHLPEDRTLPEQGWKIHVSALPGDAEDTLSVVARVCLRDHVPFKFLRSRAALAFANDKYMPRSGSGKFITVYPAHEAEFEAVATELADRLAGRDAPYVLSDLRIGAGPVFARYGAFVDLWCRDDSGAEVPALRDPSGRLVPDERDAVFRTPRWLPLPGWLGPHLAARAAAHDPSFPYTVRRALHFSNAGGIYLAEHKSTGETVVLREARPHSGLDAAGADAVRRLRREHAALERLAGVPGVPRVYGIHQVWEHVFLVEEHIEGERLLEAVIARNPVVWTNASAEDMAGYARWAGTVVDGLERLLARIHARGMRFGDLHPGNVIVRPDGSVALVDFEYAADLADRSTPWAGAPGFSAPPGADPVDVDRYGLWSTWLMMLLPLTEMLDHDPSRAELLTSVAEHLFGLPRGRRRGAPGTPRPSVPPRRRAPPPAAGCGSAGRRPSRWQAAGPAGRWQAAGPPGAARSAPRGCRAHGRSCGTAWSRGCTRAPGRAATTGCSPATPRCSAPAGTRWRTARRGCCWRWTPWASRSRRGTATGWWTPRGGPGRIRRAGCSTGCSAPRWCWPGWAAWTTVSPCCGGRWTDRRRGPAGCTRAPRGSAWRCATSPS